jgi:predicted nucleotidyltransferase
MSTQSEHISILNELTFRTTENPTVQERVLGLLLDSGGEELTESDVRASLDLPRATAHVALRSLVTQGLVQDRRIGRSRLYWVDGEDALIKALKAARSIRRARIALHPVRHKVVLAVLYGSAATGDDRRGSDIDLLVVAEDKDAVLQELARHQWLQPVVMTSGEHMRLIAEGGSFAAAVARGTVIWRRP